MAYTPTLDDINQIDPQSYQPTLSDINAIDPQNATPQQSFISSMFSRDPEGGYAGAISAGGAKFGGNVLSDIGTMAKNYANKVQSAGMLPTNTTLGNGAQTLQNVGNNVVQNASQMFDPNGGTASKAIEGVSQFAPYMLAAPYTIAGRALGAIPGIAGRALAGSIGGAQVGGAYGATQSAPGQAIPGAISGAKSGAELGLIPAAAGIAGKTISSGSSAIKNLLGGNLQDVSDSLYADVAKNPNPTPAMSNAVLDPKQLNKVNTENVIQNAKDQMKASKTGYTNFSGQVAQSGYAQSGAPSSVSYLGEQMPGAPGKFITPTNDISDNLNSILNNDPQETQMSNVSPATKGAIKNYLASPIYNNAHKLQSAFGNEAANLRSFNASPANISMANQLSQVRDNINDNITNTFNANGDTHLSDTLEGLRDNYRENVAPYGNVPSIWNAMFKKKNYPNIANLLNQDGEDIDAIRGHVLQDPDQSRLMLAQSIGKYATRDINGNMNTNAPKMLDAINNAPGHLADFRDAASIGSQTQALQSQYNRASSVPAIAKKTGKLLLHGAVLGTGYEGIHRLGEFL